MRTAIIVFAVSVVACLVGIGIGKASESPDSDAKQQKCLYAAVSAYPALPVDQLALDSVKECEGLPASEKAALRGIVSRFIESALDKSTKEG